MKKCINIRCVENKNKKCILKECKVAPFVKKNWEADIRYMHSIKHINNVCKNRDVNCRLHSDKDIIDYGKRLYFDCKKRISGDHCLFPYYINDPKCCRYYE